MDPQGGRCDKHIDSLHLPLPPPLLLTSPLHSAHASFYPSHSSPRVTQSPPTIALLLHFISLNSLSLFILFRLFYFLLIINAPLMIFFFKFHSLIPFFFLLFPLSLIAYLSISFAHSFPSFLLSSLAEIQRGAAVLETKGMQVAPLLGQ